MSDREAYDKAKWHFPATEAAGLPLEQAYVHTGMFLAWLIDRSLISDSATTSLAQWLPEFKARKRTGPALFRDALDGVLTREELSPQGNGFAEAYFDFDQGLYIDDYVELLARGRPGQYDVADSWVNYERLSSRVDQRFRQWQEGKLKPKRGALGRFGQVVRREVQAVNPAALVILGIFLVFMVSLWWSLIAERCGR